MKFFVYSAASQEISYQILMQILLQTFFANDLGWNIIDYHFIALYILLIGFFIVFKDSIGLANSLPFSFLDNLKIWYQFFWNLIFNLLGINFLND